MSSEGKPVREGQNRLRLVGGYIGVVNGGVYMSRRGSICQT